MWIALRRSSLCFLIIVAGLAAFDEPEAHAGEDPLAASLASKLLQSRAQLRIYRHDDQVDLKCQSRSFVDAKVVRVPRVTDEVLIERKWLERWVLNRCGNQIAYHVFFTEIGQGGAFFSFRQVEINIQPVGNSIVD